MIFFGSEEWKTASWFSNLCRETRPFYSNSSTSNHSYAIVGELVFKVILRHISSFDPLNQRVTHLHYKCVAMTDTLIYYCAEAQFFFYYTWEKKGFH